VSETVEDVAEKIMESMKASEDAISKAMKDGNKQKQIKEQLTIAIGTLNDQKKLLTQIYDATKNSLPQKDAKNITSRAMGYVKDASKKAAKSAATSAAVHVGHALLAGGAGSCSVM
jgi:hypothetical protein